MRAINFLNSLVGNINKPGGVLLPAQPKFDPFSKLRRSTAGKWLSLPEQLASGASPAAILFHRTNPLFTAPWLADAIKSVPFIASFSSFMDETAIVADLILPDNSNFEIWDLSASLSVASPGPAASRLTARQGEDLPASLDSQGTDREAASPGLLAAVALSRPVLSTEYDTRQTADVLIAVGKALGEDLGRSLPFGSAEEIVKAAAAELQKFPGQVPESVATPKPDAGSEQQSNEANEFWNKFLEAGVWIAKLSAPARPAAPGKPNQPAGRAAKRPAAGETARPGPADESEYPLTLLAYEHPALGLGAEANLPWLQELPEPMTTVMWGSWVEINPKTASAYSIEDGDLVEVRSSSGSVRAPALVYPAIHPSTVAMPYGQGHTAYGMYAAGRGANTAELSPVAARSPAQGETVRVSISKVSGEARLIRFGTMLPERPERHR